MLLMHTRKYLDWYIDVCILKLTGCYIRDDITAKKITITLDKVSAKACELRCKTTYFAVGGQSCICLPAAPQVSTVNQTLCNIKCDGRGMCGGDGVVNVYNLSVNDFGVDDRNFHCLRYSCPDVKTKDFKATNCDDEYQFLCENDGEVFQTKEKNWDSAFAFCINETKYLSNISSCPEINKRTAYWSSYFRGEEFIFHADNITGVPLRVTHLHSKRKSFEIRDSISSNQDIKMPFLCETVNDVTRSSFCEKDYSTQSKTRCLLCQSTTNVDADTTGRTTTHTMDIDTTAPLIPVTLIAGVISGCLLIIINLIGMCFFLKRFKTTDRANISKGGNVVQELSNTSSGHRNVKVTIHSSDNDNSNELENITGNDIDAVFLEAQEGVYDHLREHENRKI